MVKPAFFLSLAALLGAVAATAAAGDAATSEQLLDAASFVPDEDVRHRVLKKKTKKKKTRPDGKKSSKKSKAAKAAKAGKAAKVGKGAKVGKTAKAGKAAKSGKAGKGDQLYQERLEVGRALLYVQLETVADVLPHFTDDIEYHEPIFGIYGIEDMTDYLYQFLSAGDLLTEIEDETLVGDTYSVTWTMSGTFLGVPYNAKGISIFKFLRKSSLIYYWRDYYSEGDIMANIPDLDEAVIGFRSFYRCAVDPTFVCPFDGPPGGVSESSGMQLEGPGNPKALPGLDRPRSPKQLHRAQLEIGRELVDINAQDWMAVLPYLASNYEYHDPIVDIYGPATMAEFLGRLFAGSSDLITTVEEETLMDGIYMATWTMSGEFSGAPFSAQGMSIVKFVDGTLQTYYSRDYYTEGDVMLGVPELQPAVVFYRTYYRCAVDPTFDDCPL